MLPLLCLLVSEIWSGRHLGWKKSLQLLPLALEFWREQAEGQFLASVTSGRPAVSLCLGVLICKMEPGWHLPLELLTGASANSAFGSGWNLDVSMPQAILKPALVDVCLLPGTGRAPMRGTTS